MNMLNEEEKRFLLSLARSSIKHYLEKGTKPEIKPSEIPSERLQEDGAAFITLHLDGKLRGCIGSLEAHHPLVMDVMENALNSAFDDPRFYPLQADELPKIKISISVLTKPEPLPVDSPEQLLEKLVPKKHGLILKQGFHRATFLPVVWEQLPKKEEFLEHLSQKAGLPPGGWRDPKTEFEIYEAEEFEE
jgi:AmmeMemoRadiSam system protein A